MDKKYQLTEETLSINSQVDFKNRIASIEKELLESYKRIGKIVNLLSDNKNNNIHEENIHESIKRYLKNFEIRIS